ncbi:MAG: alpha/beta fold hydrolase [Ilumatobacteraceae bacterium]
MAGAYLGIVRWPSRGAASLPRGDSSTWIAAAKTLAEDHRVYAVDLRGHGDSSRTSRYSFS